MGQYQARGAKSIDEDHGERGTGVDTERGSSILVPDSQATPPLAPVFGSPIDSKYL